MGVQIRKPILIGGVGLSFALWAWISLQDSLLDWGSVSLWGLMAIGGGLWWLRRDRPSTPTVAKPRSPLTAADLTTAKTHLNTLRHLLATECPQVDQRAWDQGLAQLEQGDSSPFTAAIVGSQWVGKTALQQALPHDPPWHIVETATPTAQTAAVLYLVNGDLTAAELQHLRQWQQQHYPLLLILTKQDQYPEEMRAILLDTLRQRVQGWIAAADVVAIAAAPSPITVRQHQADGSIREFQEPRPPELGSLLPRLAQLTTETEAIARAQQWRQVMAMQGEVKAVLNAARRDRALPILERYQWIAATAAFANPVAALDLLATVAINAQLLVDLAQIHGQPLSLDQAKPAARSIGELLLKLGAVELSTQTITTVLKSSPITYAAGGLVQGISAAYLTRIVGLSLIDYLQQQDPTQPPSALNWDSLSQGIQGAIAQTQQAGRVASFVAQMRSRLLSQGA
ncbi:YcjF family protein [Spirulina major CS-329]|uniref:YcjF family protein n=1 Tax=Spirulina TaxID=1154 RepID=UPI0023309DE8|nr:MULTISPECIES: YcjF family protein [Spirulina]MDB9494260.1 YcjF family protein [Spirulina subsalsa CS-330]MDB9501825.1 YcjF family protein [Spirulina major CS-329]